MSDHCIYLLGTEKEGNISRPVKVGITKSLSSRIKIIQTGNPYKIRIIHYVTVPEKEMAEYIEGAFHHCQKNNRMSGEWFDLDPKEALKFFILYLKFSLKINVEDEDLIEQFMEASGANVAHYIIQNWQEKIQ